PQAKSHQEQQHTTDPSILSNPPAAHPVNSCLTALFLDSKSLPVGHPPLGSLPVAKPPYQS
ncbi:MAG: hypothetical protein ACKN81_16505, partial [Pirellulaceae bacterium]